MEKLYVLAGKARNGKDTVADMLEKKYKENGKKVIKLSYGVYPKFYGKLICDWDGNEETKPRTELQEISSEARSVNPGYMVRRMEEDINILQSYVDIMIISDSRMPEEVDMPKEIFKEAVTIKVERPNFESPLTLKEQQNIVETALDNYDKYDLTIINDGTLKELEDKVDNLINGG